MSDTEPGGLSAAQLRTMQIIAAAMIMGVVFAFVIFLVLALVQQKRAVSTAFEPLPIITIVSLLMLTNIPLSFVIPGILTKNQVRQIASGAQSLDSLPAIRQTTLIVGYAFLEGTAFFGCIAFFLECHAASLVVIALPLALMLAQFPTPGRVRVWLATQLAIIEELRLGNSPERAS